MKALIALLIFIILISGCVTVTRSAWVNELRNEIVPSNLNAIDSSEIFILQNDELATSLKLLEKESTLLLGSEAIYLYFPSLKPEIKEGGYLYLLRAVRDQPDGVFSVYQNKASTLVLYGHIGDCGELEKYAVAVRLKYPVTNLYGGCSGAW